MSAPQAKVQRPLLDRDRSVRTETALLALGCFWSPDAQLGALPGVVRTSSGYAGGTKDAPTYRALGDHTETVEVEFAPQELSYSDLLKVFWESHDPTRKPYKRQYMSALFTLNEEQEAAARQSKAWASEQTGSQVRTEIRPVERFFLAEGYHQNHRLRQVYAFERHFEELYPDPEAFAHSPAASRVNGYATGHGSEAQREHEIGALGLPEELQARLRQLHQRGGPRSVWQRLFG